MKNRKLCSFLLCAVCFFALPAGRANAAQTAKTAQTAETSQVAFDESLPYAEFSKIHTGSAALYRAEKPNGITVALNAGHGTKGGTSVRTFCHPDKSPKTTGGSTAKGQETAAAVSSGMAFYDGTAEAKVTLEEAGLLKDLLLEEGYDVLMLRDAEDVQLDNVARTVLANSMADCHISLHWDGDGLSYDKGAFFISVPDQIKYLPGVAENWQESELLGTCLIGGLRDSGCSIYKNGSMDIDLTQTSYSTIPSVDMELGNAASDHGQAALKTLAEGMAQGLNDYFCGRLR